MSTGQQRYSSASSPGLGKVLIVTSNFPRWAGDSTTPFVLHLAQDLQAAGWEVDVLAPHAPGAQKSESIEGVNVRLSQVLVGCNA